MQVLLPRTTLLKQETSSSIEMEIRPPPANRFFQASFSSILYNELASKRSPLFLKPKRLLRSQHTELFEESSRFFKYASGRLTVLFRIGTNPFNSLYLQRLTFDV